jgi:hypothetical protein
MNDTRTCVNLLGQRITVFQNDHVGDKIATKGLYEKENLELLLHLMQHLQSPVVLDVGANIGNHTLAFATKAAHVYAFEPIPIIFALLKQNVKQNNLSNVTLQQLALSDQNDTAIINMEWNDSLTIERLSGTSELQFMMDNYRIFVLGSSGDRQFWQGRHLAFLRRKLTKIFRQRRAVLYDFKPGRLYKNLLLIPNDRQDLLDRISIYE